MKNNYLTIMGMILGLLAYASVSQAQINVSSNVTDVSCIGNCDGIIDITPTGGVGNYTYLWSGGELTQDINSLCVGPYTVTVTEDLSTPFDWIIPNSSGNHTVFVDVTNILIDGVGVQVGDYIGPFYDSAGTLACGGYHQFDQADINSGLTGVAGWGANSGVDDGFQPGELFSWKYFRISDGREIDISVTYIPINTPPYMVTHTNAYANLGMSMLASVTATTSLPLSTTHTGTVGQPLPISTTGSTVNVSSNGGNDGSVDLTVVNGVSGFSFLWSNGAITEDISGLIADTYNVTVTDANGCTGTGSYLIIEPSLVALSTVLTDVTCYNGSNGAIDLSISGGVSPYSVSWIGGNTNEDLTGLTAGTYNVTVTDDNSAIATGSWTINEGAEILLAGSITDVDCNGNSTGEIDLSVTNGVSPLNYIWSNNETIEDITGLALGTYLITVTDADGCTGSDSYNVWEPSTMGYSTALSSYSGFNVSVNGGSDGTIDLTVTGGTSPYSYSWSTGATIEDITGLSAGTYTVTITDDNSCSIIGTATLTEPAPVAGVVNISGITTDVDCNANCNGEIDITATGGTTPYIYSWSTGSTDEDVTGLCAGNYSVTVTDASGVLTGGPFDWYYTNTGSNATIMIPGNSTILIDGQAPVTGDYFGVFYDSLGTLACGGYIAWDPSGTAVAAWGDEGNLQPNGFAAGEVFKWKYFRLADGIEIDLVATYLPLFPAMRITHDSTYATQGGSAIATLTGFAPPPSSANQGFASFTITEPDVLDATGVETNVSCFSGNDGSIDLTVTGGTTSYNYLWSDNATTEDISGLTIGTYGVTVTDAEGCSTTASFTITEPTVLGVTGTESMVSCFNGNNGSIDITVTGGTTTFSFAWSNSMNTEDISNLVAGTYSVTVTDALGCTATESFIITEPADLIVIGTVTNLLCNGTQSGEIDVTVTGGTGSYAYSWDTGSSIADLVGLSGGTYSLTVTDDNSCTSEVSFTVIEPDAMVLSGNATGTTCNGGTDGSIDLTVSGGTAGYSFIWTDGYNTEDVSSLAAGNYDVTVTDSNNCISNDSYTVSEPALLAATDVTSDISCYNYNDGAIDLTVTGGTGMYTFLWSDNSTDEDMTGLAAGSYSVTITDANMCTALYSYSITEPVLLEVTGVVTNLDCYATQTGEIDITVTGGTMTYDYLWNDNSIIDDRVGLSGGVYTVIVTDDNGCNISASYTVIEPSLFIATGVSTDVSCYNGTDGAIDLTVTGGVPGYTFNWTGGFSTEDLTGLTAGNYDITVLDNNNCPAMASFTIAQPYLLDATDAITDVTCNGYSDGAIDISVTGGTINYTYLWSTGAVSEDLSGLSAGLYELTITDGMGCTFTGSYEVIQPAVLDITSSVTDLLCNGLQNGAIDITVNGGTMSYVFLWEDGSSLEDRTGLSGGNYAVTVTDGNGCQEFASFTVIEPVALVLTSTLTNVNCFNGTDGAIDISVSGGTGSYLFDWSDGSSTEDLIAIIADDFTVTITDGNGCTITDTYTITEPALLDATESITNVNCFNGNDGAIDLTVSGGTTVYSFEWSNGILTEDISGLIAGTYTVTITDANNCTYINSYVVTEPSSGMSLTAVVSDVTLLGGSDGEIDLTVSGGTYPYLFSWDNGMNIEDLFGLTEGTYTVIVTDGNGCTETTSVYVNQPPASPDWTFINTGINHTILIPITASMDVYGTPLQAGDYIGLFYDSLGTDVCGGYLEYTGNVAAIAAWGAQSGLNDGFADGEEFTWRVWVAASNIEYAMEASYIPAGSQQITHEQYFASNGISGLNSLFVSGGTQTIALDYMWNIVSSYINANDMNFSSIFSDIVGNVDLVKDENGLTFWPSYSINMIGNWISQEGYRVRMNTIDTLIIEGEFVNPAALPIDMIQGWSLFAYPRTSEADASIMLASISANMVLAKDEFGWAYWPYYGMNAIGNLKPGEGYAALMITSSTLIYPANSANVAKSSLVRESAIHYGQLSNTGENMTIGIPLSSWDVTPSYGDEIAVFNSDGKLSGKAVFTNDNMAIPVWGDDSETNNVEGLVSGEEFSLMIWNKNSNTERTIEMVWSEGSSSYETNAISVAAKVTIIDNMLFSLDQNMPNPVTNSTEISFSIAKECNVELAIYNILGDRLEVIHNGIMKAGQYSAIFNADNYAAGTYIYRIEAGSFISSKQMNIIK